MNRVATPKPFTFGTVILTNGIANGAVWAKAYMIHDLDSATSRRALLKSALVGAGAIAVSACASRSGLVAQLSAAPEAPPVAQPVLAVAKMAPVTPQHVSKVGRLPVPEGVRPQLYDRALAALDRHAGRVASHDRIAIADFTVPSAEARFHFIDLGTGNVESMLVAHGMGSDPSHTGILHRFSNDPGSNATCEGALTAGRKLEKVTPIIRSASTASHSGWSGSTRPTTMRSTARSWSTPPGIRIPR